jgi:signal transduction histidine kinase
LAPQESVATPGGRVGVRGWQTAGRIDPRFERLIKIASLAAAYYGAAELGYSLEVAGPVAAIVWLPVGVGIAFLCLGGPGLWPGVLVGDLLANDYAAMPIGSAVGQTCGNVIEVVVVAAILRRLARRRPPLDSVAQLGRTLAAIAVGTAISATVGSVSLLLGGVLTAHAAPGVWRTWWLGDACGALVVVPLALAWRPPWPRALWRGRAWEAGLTLAATAAAAQLALRSPSPVTYLVFPPLIWSALRFGRHGATVTIALTAGFTVWHAAHITGPFAYESITHSVLSTQLFIAVAALSTLSLAAVVAERARLADRLRASRGRLVGAADDERRRLEHNLHDGAQQRLTALAVHLGLAADEAERAPERAPELFRDASAELGLAIDDLRTLAQGIHPVTLTELGLAAAIAGIVARSTVPVTTVELPARRVDTAAEASAYYVVAEAVTNAQKHSGASSIELRVAVAGGGLRVLVADDGIGGARASAGSGLEGLRDRVEAGGGRFWLVSPAGQGTQVVADIPPTAPAAQDLTRFG